MFQQPLCYQQAVKGKLLSENHWIFHGFYRRLWSQNEEECVLVWETVHFKGQLISKRFFGVIDFLQKTNERIRLYYSGRLVFVRFVKEIDNFKKPFRN